MKDDGERERDSEKQRVGACKQRNKQKKVDKTEKKKRTQKIFLSANSLGMFSKWFKGIERKRKKIQKKNKTLSSVSNKLGN